MGSGVESPAGEEGCGSGVGATESALHRALVNRDGEQKDRRMSKENVNDARSRADVAHDMGRGCATKVVACACACVCPSLCWLTSEQQISIGVDLPHDASAVESGRVRKR